MSVSAKSLYLRMIAIVWRQLESVKLCPSTSANETALNERKLDAMLDRV